MSTHLASDGLAKDLTLSPFCGTRECALYFAGGRSVFKDVKLSGNGAQTTNLFTLTGQNRVLDIYFIVSTATNSTTLTNVKFELDDGGAQDDITDTVACSGAVAGATGHKNRDSTNPLVFTNPTVGVIDDPPFMKEQYEFLALQKTGGVTTYIRLSYTGDANTDVDIRAVVRYQPLDENCIIEAV